MGLGHPTSNHFWTCRYCSNGVHGWCHSLNCCCPLEECSKTRSDTLRKIIDKKDFWKKALAPNRSDARN